MAVFDAIITVGILLKMHMHVQGVDMHGTGLMYCMPGADVYGVGLDSMAMSCLDVHNKLPYFVRYLTFKELVSQDD
jgi:hypothetical protein